jgi:hypothetical protein
VKVSASWTQKSRSKDQECVAVSSFCKKMPLGSADMVAKKEDRKKEKEKKRKGKDDRTLIRSNLTYLPLDLLWSQANKRRKGNHKD